MKYKHVPRVLHCNVVVFITAAGHTKAYIALAATWWPVYRIDVGKKAIFQVQQSHFLEHVKVSVQHQPDAVLTWRTFPSISATATFFFRSGLSFQYIIVAAFLTASSNLLSVDNLRTSASFSEVIPLLRIV